MTSKKCIVDWCNRKSRCKGYCQRHYDQMYRYGEIRQDVEKPTTCSFPNCDRKICAKGLCNSHWAQLSRHGVLKPIVTDESVEDRFWRQVKKSDNPDGCWNWKGPETGKYAVANKQGYGQLYWKGSKWMAHRFSYMLKHGELPEHMQLDHTCRNKMCVNPDHLELVTQLDNMRRMRAYWVLVKEIQRLRSLVVDLGGEPGADILAVSELQENSNDA